MRFKNEAEEAEYLAYRASRHADALPYDGHPDLGELDASLDIISVARDLGLDPRPYGERYRMRVPWRDDNSPSLDFYREGGVWKFIDRGRGEGGKSIDLIQRMKNYSIKEVLDWLEARGVRVPRQVDARVSRLQQAHTRGKEVVKPPYHAKDFEMLRIMAQWWEGELDGKIAATRDVVGMLKSKWGIDREIARRAGIGCCATRDVCNALKGDGEAVDRAIRLGILRHPTSPFLLRHITIPVVDRLNRVIHIVGRAIVEQDLNRAKYLTPPVHRDGCPIRGDALGFAKNGIGHLGGDGPVVVSEGQMDSIVLAECGYLAAIMSGASLADRAIVELAVVAGTRPIVVFGDPDEAGIAAGEKLLGKLKAEGAQATLCFSPDVDGRKSDPADHFRDHGSQSVRELIGGAVQAM